MLAFGEIRRSKTKFSLMVMTVGLVVFLLMVVSAMGDGLITGMTGAISGLDGDLFVLQKDTHLSFQRSVLPHNLESKIKDVEGVKRVTTVGQLSVTARVDLNKTDASLFGMDRNATELITLTKGKLFDEQEPNQAVVDRGLAKNGLALGDFINIEPAGHRLKVVGFTENRKYTMMPVVYVSLKAWQDIRQQMLLSSGKLPVSSQALQTLVTDDITTFVVSAEKADELTALAARITEVSDKIEVADEKSVLQSVGGIKQMTMAVLGLKVVALAICAAVIGVFFYIMILHKTGQIGTLKALGASNFYIYRQLLYQSLIVVAAGSLIGWIASVFCVRAAESSMGTVLTAMTTLNSIGAVLVMAVIGSLFSLRSILRVDPIVALGRIQ